MSKKPDERATVRWMERLYDGLNILIAYILLLTGLALTIYTCVDVVHQFASGQGVVEITMTLVHHLLLILIVLEILWTLKNYIKTHRLSVEAFLIIAIISSVRKVLVISMDVPSASHPNGNLVSPVMVDLAIETGIIFLMVLAIFVLRRSQQFVPDETASK